MKLSFSEAKQGILADIARQKNKPVEDLQPFEDYHPIDIDERAYQVSNRSSGVVWTGD